MTTDVRSRLVRSSRTARNNGPGNSAVPAITLLADGSKAAISCTAPSARGVASESQPPQRKRHSSECSAANVSTSELLPTPASPQRSTSLPAPPRTSRNERSRAASWSCRSTSCSDAFMDGVAVVPKMSAPAASSVVSRQRIDDLGYFCHLCDRDTAQLGMLSDRSFTLGKVDAESLVTSHVTVLPLDFADLGNCLI